jgi:hypothetical protein
MPNLIIILIIQQYINPQLGGYGGWRGKFIEIRGREFLPENYPLTPAKAC